MTAKWQQWMPFHIDRFMGSRFVQALEPAARWGYLSLLSAQWQSSDCSISSDPQELAEESGLGDDLWSLHAVRILRKFKTLEDGRLRNDVCFEEWQEAKRIFEARKASAHRTVTARSPHGHHTVTDSSPSRPAHTITGTVTGTVTETVKQGERASAPPPSPEPVPPEKPFPDVDLHDEAPEGLAMVQYGQHACRRLGIAESYRNQIAMQDGIEALMRAESQPPHIAAATLIQRARDHPPPDGKWRFWIDDGGWKQVAKPHVKSHEQRQAEAEAQERVDYERWAGMSVAFRAKNPWKGKIFSDVKINESATADG